MADKFDVYQTVTDKLIEQLERDDLGKWKSPWVRNNPQNLDGRAYSGINWFLLGLTSADFASQTYGTYRAWQNAGSQVCKGQHGHTVIFYKEYRAAPGSDDETVGDDGKVSRRVARAYKVFAAEQCEGDAAERAISAELHYPNAAQSVAAADQLTAAYSHAENVSITHEGQQAYYRPSTDAVVMPPMPSFNSTEGYYGTLLHEITHSTGTEARCNRDKQNNRYGNEAYAYEELVAEIGSAMLCSALGIEEEPRLDHSQYVASWLKVLKNNKRAVFTAAAAAQRAADFVLKYRVSDLAIAA